MTRDYGVKNSHIFGIPDPDLPIHYTTFIGLRRRLKSRLLLSRPMLKPFSGEKMSRRNGAQNGGLEKMEVDTLVIDFATPKRHFLARNRVV